MKKTIFWIDDNIGVIKNIAESIFPHFWKIDEENGIETYVRILGNGIQEPPGLGLWEEGDEQELQEFIDKIFERLCRDVDVLGEKKLYAKKKYLVCDSVKIMYKKTEDSEGKKECEEYRKLCSIWQGNPLEKSNGNVERIAEEARVSAKKALKKMNIEKGACVGLDLALLQRDIEKVRDEKKPILSMELYHMIKEEHECFLYSFYFFDNMFVESWKSVYAKYYCDKEEPIIHKRCDMYKKNISSELITNFLSMIDKSYAKEEKNNVGKMENSD